METSIHLVMANTDNLDMGTLTPGTGNHNSKQSVLTVDALPKLDVSTG